MESRKSKNCSEEIGGTLRKENCGTISDLVEQGPLGQSEYLSADILVEPESPEKSDNAEHRRSLHDIEKKRIEKARGFVLDVKKNAERFLQMGYNSYGWLAKKGNSWGVKLGGDEWKKTFMAVLDGPTGTGKTTLIKYAEMLISFFEKKLEEEYLERVMDGNPLSELWVSTFENIVTQAFGVVNTIQSTPEGKEEALVIKSRDNDCQFVVQVNSGDESGGDNFKEMKDNVENPYKRLKKLEEKGRTVSASFRNSQVLLSVQVRNCPIDQDGVSTVKDNLMSTVKKVDNNVVKTMVLLTKRDRSDLFDEEIIETAKDIGPSYGLQITSVVANEVAKAAVLKLSIDSEELPLVNEKPRKKLSVMERVEAFRAAMSIPSCITSLKLLNKMIHLMEKSLPNNKLIMNSPLYFKSCCDCGDYMEQN